MSELEQTLREALEREDIHIEHQSDGSYLATWPSRYGGLIGRQVAPTSWIVGQVLA